MTPARCRYHTCSTHGRGLELLIGTYNYPDLTPLGRQEEQEEPTGRSNSPFVARARHHGRPMRQCCEGNGLPLRTGAWPTGNSRVSRCRQKKILRYVDFARSRSTEGQSHGVTGKYRPAYRNSI
jgi:hypothetical protein